MTGWAGGAIALPDTGFWLPAEVGSGVVGLVFAGVDGAVVVHRAVQHRIIRIAIIIRLFKGITTVIMVMREICVEKPLFSHIFSNLQVTTPNFQIGYISLFSNHHYFDLITG